MDVRLAVPPLGHEPFGGRDAVRPEGRVVASLDLAGQLAVIRPPEFGDRRQVDSRIRVEIVPTIGGVPEGMVAIPLGHPREAGSVEFDPGVVDVVGVLAGLGPVGPEPDLAGFFVDSIDAADEPFALRDLVLDSPGPRVHEVEVVPAVPLGHPEDFIRLVEELQVDLVRVVDERRRRLLDQGLGVARLGVDGDDPEDLVASLVVEEGESFRVGRPPPLVDAPGVGEEGVGDRDRLPGRDVEEVRPGDRQLVAGLGIVVVRQLRLELVLGRGIDQVDLPRVPWAVLMATNFDESGDQKTPP